MKELSSVAKLVVFGAEVGISAAASYFAARTVQDSLVDAHMDKVYDPNVSTAEVGAIGFMDGALSAAAGLGMWQTCSGLFTIVNAALGISADLPEIDA